MKMAGPAEDGAIVEALFARSEEALRALDSKYGRRLRALAQHIVSSQQDAEECVNDAWLRAWNAIPPQRPDKLQLFLAKIVRNLAFDRFQARHAEKRGGGEILLGELAECLPGSPDPQKQMEDQEVAGHISRFLRGLPKESRRMFLLRYWYGSSVAEIAGACGCGAGKVKSALFRTRKALRAYLEREGVVL